MNAEEQAFRPTTARWLAGNVAMSLLGIGVPVLVGVALTPLTLSAMGPERYSALSLAWVVFGYLSFLDFGIGRALTHVIATSDSAPPPTVASTVWTGVSIQLLMGVAVAVILGLGSDGFAKLVMGRQALAAEFASLLRSLAICLPASLVALAFRGLLEGLRRFWIVSAVRIATVSATFAAPLAVFSLGGDLGLVGWALSGLQIASAALLCAASVHYAPSLVRPSLPTRRSLISLMRYGRWVTATNLLAPLLLNVDRFVLARFVPLAALVYYVVPSDALVRLQFLPSGINAVAFPTLSSLPTRSVVWRHVYRRLSVLLTSVAIISSTAVVLAAEPLLRLWLGASFAHEAWKVMSLLGTAYLLESVTWMPHAAIFAAGVPAATTRAFALSFTTTAIQITILVAVAGVGGAAVGAILRSLSILLFTLAVAHKATGQGRVEALGGVSAVVIVAIVSMGQVGYTLFGAK